MKLFNNKKEKETVQDTKVVDITSGLPKFEVPVIPMPPPHMTDYKALYEKSQAELERTRQLANLDPYAEFLTNNYKKVDTVDDFIDITISELREIRKHLRMSPFD